MSTYVSGDGGVGRAKHLGELAWVFHHRHGSWRDFGWFLKWLFSDLPPGVVDRYQLPAAPAQHQVFCRHNPGGENYDTLQACTQDPQAFPMFNKERYRRQCLGIGAWERDKNPGLVVEDLCHKAKEFLLCIDRGDCRDQLGRDYDYNPDQNSQSTEGSAPSEMEVDSQGSIDMANVIDEVLRPLPQPESFDGDDWFDDTDFADAVGEAAGIERSMSPGTTLTAPSGFSGLSHDSVLQRDGKRVSTKMRAATLGYLWQFADRPKELRNEFRRLRREAELLVLHLCGCGMCYSAPDGAKVYGCSERSHLQLGSSDENATHKSWHTVMADVSKSGPEGYIKACEAARMGEAGRDLF